MTAMRRMRFFRALFCAALIAGGCERKEDTPTTTTRPVTSAAKPPDRQPADRPASDRQPQPTESQAEPLHGGEAKPEPAEIKPASGAVPAGAVPAGAAPAGDVGQIEPAELILPKVLLTHGQAETCLVGVGDPMPAIRLPDLAGKEQPLAQLLGERLTVVAFWRLSNPYAVAELADLERDVAQRFGRRGVRVVAIDELDKPDQVRQTVQKLGVKFPVLLDANGQALAQVATRKLPRTYLLDASGKIVWFDIEYSRSTWRDMRQAIQFLLSQD